jgi:hypothetical protein
MDRNVHIISTVCTLGKSVSRTVTCLLNSTERTAVYQSSSAHSVCNSVYPHVYSFLPVYTFLSTSLCLSVPYVPAWPASCLPVCMPSTCPTCLSHLYVMLLLFSLSLPACSAWICLWDLAHLPVTLFLAGPVAHWLSFVPSPGCNHRSTPLTPVPHPTPPSPPPCSFSVPSSHYVLLSLSLHAVPNLPVSRIVLVPTVPTAPPSLCLPPLNCCVYLSECPIIFPSALPVYTWIASVSPSSPLALPASCLPFPFPWLPLPFFPFSLSPFPPPHFLFSTAWISLCYRPLLRTAFSLFSP